jgi:hypothetical protein
MAIGPDILLLDEPFSVLDPATRQHLRAWLRDTANRLRLTIVLVTHDVDEAVYLGPTITALDGAGATAGSWTNPTAPEHDDLVAHPLRAELLASYRSQVGGPRHGPGCGWLMVGLSRQALFRGAVALGAAGGLAGIADLATAAASTARAGTAAMDGGALRIGYLPITDASPLLVAHAQASGGWCSYLRRCSESPPGWVTRSSTPATISPMTAAWPSFRDRSARLPARRPRPSAAAR